MCSLGEDCHFKQSVDVLTNFESFAKLFCKKSQVVIQLDNRRYIGDATSQSYIEYCQDVDWLTSDGTKNSLQRALLS